MIVSILNSIAESFHSNLIAENRYQMILNGLQVTLLITFCAAVLGTLLGGLVCWARMSRHAWLQQAMTTHGHETLKERQYRHPDIPTSN